MMWVNQGYEPIDAEKEVKGKWRSLSYLAASFTSIILIGSSLYYVKYAPPTMSTAIYPLADGDLVYLRMKDGRYWRVDENDRIVTSDFPWLQGSRFILETVDQMSWKVKTRRTGRYVVIDGDTSQLTTSDIKGYWYTPKTFMMRSVAVSAHQSDNSTAQSPQSTDSKDFNGYVMSSTNTLEERDDHSVAASANLRAQLSFQGSGSDVFVFPVPHVHGVNIGSWFIPERWMQTSFYEGVDDYWSQLCGLVKMKGFAEAEARMQNHLATWFTEKDFDFLYSQGITSIRIPLGYWNIIQDPYNMYVPTNYLDSVKYLDWAFDQAESRGMTIMLDFHAAPGSQNGYDHSGCGYGSLNGEKWNVEENKQLSLNAIDALAARYTKRPGLVAIELLNEPAEDLEANHHEELLDYYTKGYDIVRKYSDTVIVSFNILWSDYYGRWLSDLAEPRFYNVLMDWHLYDFGAASMDQHLARTQQFDDWISNHSSAHPIVVGEWSGSMTFARGADTAPVYVNSQLHAYQKAWGWYYWNFKIMEPGWRVWSFQSMIEDGYDFGITKPKISSSSPSTSSTSARRSPIASTSSEAVLADVESINSNDVDTSDTLPLSKRSAAAAVTNRRGPHHAAASSNDAVNFHRPLLQDMNMGQEHGQDQVRDSRPSLRH